MANGYSFLPSKKEGNIENPNIIQEIEIIKFFS